MLDLTWMLLKMDILGMSKPSTTAIPTYIVHNRFCDKHIRKNELILPLTSFLFIMPCLGIEGEEK